MIEPIDLGVCRGVEWHGDAGRTAIVLPGAQFGGMPSAYYAALTLFEMGRRVIQVFDAYDHKADQVEWVVARTEAALEHAGAGVDLIVAKSMTTRVTGIAADRGLKGIWLTPLLGHDDCAEGLRRRTAPALLIGGTEDGSWDGPLARELGDEVLELQGADHSLAVIEHLPLIVDAVRRFA